jgi:hypothetical protein
MNIEYNWIFFNRNRKICYKTIIKDKYLINILIDIIYNQIIRLFIIYEKILDWYKYNLEK